MDCSEMKGQNLGEIGYVAYGEEPHPVYGAWRTFDGREMPTLDDMKQTEGGRFTLQRWEAAADKIVSAFIDNDSKYGARAEVRKALETLGAREKETLSDAALRKAVEAERWCAYAVDMDVISAYVTGERSTVPEVSTKEGKALLARIVSNMTASKARAHPTGVPTMGRVVYFSRDGEVERPAIVTGWQDDNTHRGGTLSLTVFSRTDSPVNDFAPGLEGYTDVGGRRWRWPPRT